MKEKKFRFEPKQTETRSVSRNVSVCFVKPKKIFFGLFRCFEPISKQPKQTELFRNEPKQSGIFLKIPKFLLKEDKNFGRLVKNSLPCFILVCGKVLQTVLARSSAPLSSTCTPTSFPPVIEPSQMTGTSSGCRNCFPPIRNRATRSSILQQQCETEIIMRHTS